MWHYLENIRKQPKPVRNTYAFLGALIVTLVIVVVWSLSVPSRIASIFQEDTTSQSPPSQLFSGLRSWGGSLTAQLQQALLVSDSATIGTDTAPVTAATSTRASTTYRWQREYAPAATSGTPVLLATTSSVTKTTATTTH